MIVEKKIFPLAKSFPTESGVVLSKPVVAYEEYGKKDGPVIYLAHGGLSSHHAAGKYSENDLLPGWWDGLIGPGKVFDTEKYRIISANSLGSMYGTTSPLTINPDTNCRYGPNFPPLTFIDMVRFHKLFLEEMGIKKLFMMAGVSMGAMQTLQMAALYPDFVGYAVSVATAGRMTPSGILMHHFIINALKMDPEFNGGCYDAGDPLLAMKLIHQIIKVYYIDQKLVKQTIWDKIPEGQNSQTMRSHALGNFLTATLDADIQGRDPNCYITLLSAINSFDLGRDAASYEEGVQRIKCPVLLINIDTDQEFPPAYAYEVAEILNKNKPKQAEVQILNSAWGHFGCVKEFDQMTKYIGNFIERLGK